jgi:hypothetical protein
MSASKTFGHNERIPESARDVWMTLCQEVAMLTHKWDTYLKLFADQERAGMLFDTANSFFQTIEESLRADMCMTIGRMSDKKRVSGFDTISFDRLRMLCADVPQINDLIDEFQLWCEQVRTYRDKLVAHNDLDAIIQPRNTPLFAITRTIIAGVVSRAQGILNSVLDHYAQRQLAFDILHAGGATKLIQLVEVARNHPDELPQGP